MKAARILTIVSIAAALVSGCGKASPETDVTCEAVAAVSYTGVATGFFQVVKSVSLTDAGLGGEQPANGLTATIFSPVDSVQICAGNCTDGSGSFDVERDVETDDNGLLIYTLGLDPSGPYTGPVFESFGAQNTCTTDVSLTSAAP